MTEPQQGPSTAGALLRAAREKQGLHIAALAAAIKVSPRKLDALENDRHAELPDATFVRALAQTVCRTLKVDAKPVLDLLPPATAVALEPGSGGLNAPFRDRPGREVPGLALVAARPLVLTAGVLLLAAVAMYVLPGGWWSGLWPARPAALPATVSAPAAPAAQPASAAADGAPAAVLSSVATAASAPEPVVAQPMVETVFSAPQAAQSASDAAAAAPTGLVQLRSSEATWVEVRDARGQLLLSRTVLPGESVGLDGNLPIRLVIGNAAATQLGFRGQPVDLAPRTRDNIARVELQ